MGDQTVDRRSFLKLGAVATGGVVLGSGLSNAGTLRGARSISRSSRSVDSLTAIYDPGVIPHIIPQIAQQIGMFEKHSLDVNLVATSNPFTPVLSGSANIGFPAPSVLVTAIGQGQGAKALCTSYKNNLDCLLAPTSLANRLQHKGKFPQILQELKGMSIGNSVAGGGADHDLRYMIKVAGMSPSDFNLIYTSGGQAEVNALLTGQFDVAFAQHPAADEVVAAGEAQIILNLAIGQGPKTMQFPYTMAAATTSWLNNNQRAAKRFVAAMAATDQWILNPKNKARLEPIITDLLPGLPSSILNNVYKTIVVSAYPQITEADISKINAYSIVSGLIKTPLTYGTMIENGLGLPT